MQAINTKLFEGKEQPLIIYNGQALINQAFRFFTVIDCVDVPYEEIGFDFLGYLSSYFRIFNEREGKLILDLSLSRSGSYLIANASVNDMTFDDLGNYYYEIGYNNSGYELVLRYGIVTII